MHVLMHEHAHDAHLELLRAVEQRHGPHHQHGDRSPSPPPSPLRPLSAPMHGSNPVVCRDHAHASVEHNGDQLVLGPHGVRGGHDHGLHVVQHGGQQHGRQGAHGAPWSPGGTARRILDQKNGKSGHAAIAGRVAGVIAAGARCPFDGALLTLQNSTLLASISLAWRPPLPRGGGGSLSAGASTGLFVVLELFLYITVSWP